MSFSGISAELVLAATYAAAMSSRAPDGEDVQGRWLLPSWYLCHDYAASGGGQDDALRFLMQLLFSPVGGGHK